MPTAAATARSHYDHDLLSPDEERDLSRLVQCGAKADERLKRDERKLSAAQRARLCRASREGKRARDRFVLSNQRLVYKVASAFSSAASLDDLTQEGNIGLIRAVEKFDGERGFRFSTYATWWIKQSIMHALSNKAAVDLPPSLRTQVRHYWQQVDDLRSQMHREPTLNEIQQAMLASDEEMATLMPATRTHESLDRPISVERAGGDTLGDLLLSDDDDDTPFTATVRSELIIEAVESKYDLLTAEERNVVSAHFSDLSSGAEAGLHSKQRKTLYDRAMSKMRHPSSSDLATADVLQSL